MDAPRTAVSPARLSRQLAIGLLVLMVSAASACGASDDGDRGIRLVSADEGASLLADPPDDLVVLDVRTPDEFAAGHIDGAIMIDFYEADFATQLADLDPDVPYLLYCRSGNRSGQTTAILDQLGFLSLIHI